MIQRAPQVPLRFIELIAKRPFTHPDYIPKDRDVMLHMAKRVCMVLETLCRRVSPLLSMNQMGAGIVILFPGQRI